MMKCRNSLLSRLTALVLMLTMCASMTLSAGAVGIRDLPGLLMPGETETAEEEETEKPAAPQPEPAEDVSGQWKEITFHKGGTAYNVYALVFSPALENVTSFEFMLEVAVSSNARCRNWQLWIGNRGTYEEASVVALPNGNGRTTALIEFRNAVNIDTVAITPMENGSYTYTFDFSLHNVRRSTSGQSGSTFPEYTTTGIAVSGGIARGDWESGTIKGRAVGVFRMTTPVKDCTSFDISVNIDMHSGAKSYDWEIWVGEKYQMTKVADMHLDGGTGSARGTVELSKPKSFDKIAVTPKSSGSYSWDISMELSNFECDGATTKTEVGKVPGNYESVVLPIGSTNKRTSLNALTFDVPLQKVVAFDLNIDAQMEAGCACKEWQIWVRSDRSFNKVDVIELETGNGRASKTVHLRTPTNINAIAVTPKGEGSFSWSIEVAMHNPQYNR